MNEKKRRQPKGGTRDLLTIHPWIVQNGRVWTNRAGHPVPRWLYCTFRLVNVHNSMDCAVEPWMCSIHFVGHLSVHIPGV